MAFPTLKKRFKNSSEFFRNLHNFFLVFLGGLHNFENSFQQNPEVAGLWLRVCIFLKIHYSKTLKSPDFKIFLKQYLIIGNNVLKTKHIKKPILEDHKSLSL